MIKFNKHNVSDPATGRKARIHYSLDNRTDNRPCVTLYAKDYAHDLGAMFGDAYKNDSDYQSDYFDRGRVTLFEDHPLYSEARKAALAHLAPPEPATDIDPRIIAFAKAIEQAEIEGLKRIGCTSEVNLKNCQVHIKPKRKYINVDIGSSGAYLIDKEGNIYGIKGYGVPHFGHRYGTIDHPVIRSRFERILT